MFKIIVFKLFFTIALTNLVSSASITNSSKDEWGRIVGASEVSKGLVPYQVSLRQFGVRHFCGATIITSKAILTAAHCLEDGGWDRQAGFRRHGVPSDSGGMVYLRKFFLHENYDNMDLNNDIAKVFTMTEMLFGKDVKAVKLNKEPLEPRQFLQFSGWGSTSYAGKLSNDLLLLYVQSIPLEDCQKAYQDINPVFKSQICTEGRPGQGACHGDAGGPLLQAEMQVSILSWGIPCARGKPDVFTRVDSFIDWIEKTLEDNN